MFAFLSNNNYYYYYYHHHHHYLIFILNRSTQVQRIVPSLSLSFSFLLLILIFNSQRKGTHIQSKKNATKNQKQKTKLAHKILTSLFLFLALSPSLHLPQSLRFFSFIHIRWCEDEDDDRKYRKYFFSLALLSFNTVKSFLSNFFKKKSKAKQPKTFAHVYSRMQNFNTYIYVYK